MSYLWSAVVAVVLAVAFTAAGEQVALATPTLYAQQGPSAEPTTSADPNDPMAGMDHDGPMAGMDHDQPTAAIDHGHEPADPAGPTAAPSATTDAQSHASESHAGTEAAQTPRPQGLVIGGFAILNGAVLLSAGVLRRRTKLRGGQVRTSRSAK